ncbi:MAG: pyruvate kinase [Bifidobacteriaceae bacterium]|jgi:pyruvate kinase|nr:pyruvate kinase [Bifidobacteriaceae bacterium]
MRRAKIVTTIGPAIEEYDKILECVKAGMDVARLNRSHGDSDTHLRVYNNVRNAAKEAGRNVAVLVDLQGPKIRLGRFKDDQKQYLELGQTFTITTDDILGDNSICSTTFKGLPGDCSAGDPLLIDDGKVKLEVVEVNGNNVVTKVVVAGPVSNNKGINLPGVPVSIPALSEKDIDDLRWGVRTGADLIALSFVRDAKDYEDVKKIMVEEGRIVPVIAKVEKPQAVDNLEEIVKTFDGIMVARGDLGVEMPLEAVPLIQKRCISLCRKYGKPVIVATQVLESMTNSPTPTRAEVSDCANAILDGADATMTSGETSVGDYPALTIATMARISEHQTDNGINNIPHLSCEDISTGGIVTSSAATIAEDIDAKFIVCLTTSGISAQRISRVRGKVPVIALTSNEHARALLALSWGIEADILPTLSSTDEVISTVDHYLIDSGKCQNGDKVVVVFGTPVGKVGSTNSIVTHVVGVTLD